MSFIGEKMKNYKIKRKLSISYTVIIILFVIGMAVSIWNLWSIRDKVETFYEGPFIASNSANAINTEFERMQKSVFRAISTIDSVITDEAIKSAKEASEVIQKELAIIEKHYLGDQKLIDNLKAALNELAPMRSAVLTLAEQQKNIEAAEYMEHNNIIVIQKAQKYLDELITNTTNKGEELVSDLKTAQLQAIITLTILAAASIIVSILFAGYITKGISNPVAEIEKAAEGLAQGKIDAEILYESEDELGHLAESMRRSMKLLGEMIHDLSFLAKEIAEGNFQVKTKSEHAYIGEFRPILLSMRDMNRSLSNTLSQINVSSEQVALGSTQMAQNAQSLAEGATEQAGAVEELNATIENVTELAEESAQNTKQAYEQIKISTDQAEINSKEMVRLTEAMERINETSKEIGNIIGAIEDIASQTNMLSLNASIEAARAGEAGRGFAVVAAQIGKLAADSAQSAVTTKELIVKTLDEIAHGNEITNKTSKAFNEVIESMKSFAQVAHSTSSQSLEQANSLLQVKEGVEQISSVIQSNSAAAEESSATSEELAAQAENLKTLVSKFQLLS